MKKYTALVQHAVALGEPTVVLPNGFYDIYLAPEADARIAELEKALREIAEFGDANHEWGDTCAEMARKALGL